MILAAARRFALLLVIAGAVTTALALLFGALIGAPVDRSVSVGFYLTGSFLLIGGFFVGNRGPIRLRRDEGATLIPFLGPRAARWATLDEQEHTIHMSALYVVLGLALVLIGIAVDSRYSLV